MKKATVVILTLDEVKRDLVEFYTGITEDIAHMRELIAAGDICTYFPNLKTMTPDQLVQLHADTCIGEKYFAATSSSICLIQTGDYTYAFSACKEQNPHHVPYPKPQLEETSASLERGLEQARLRQFVAGPDMEKADALVAEIGDDQCDHTGQQGISCDLCGQQLAI